MKSDIVIETKIVGTFSHFSLFITTYDGKVGAVTFRTFNNREPIYTPVFRYSDIQLLENFNKFGDRLPPSKRTFLLRIDKNFFWLENREVNLFNSVFPFDFLLNSKG
ncbi:hypothetical protein [Vibrio litoralis]|uniref:hypothetical protein n=1 Tax=Vibrio litoralis TaxID=335972 RepID=UPI0004872C11|nr:hypothetical protein [Vibrio litoralis]